LFSIQPTSMPPSAAGSVSTPDSQAIVSASWRTYGLSVPICGAPVVVMLIVGIVPSAL
jgi:hypothetical protein